MSAPANPVIVIPVRMASTRLPGKPLAEIAGEPMVVHVWRQAVAARVGPVVVACGDELIADAVSAAGGHAVMTRTDHVSGSDRVHEAIETLDPDRKHDAVINLQGDLPMIESGVIRAVLGPMREPAVDISTLAAEITDPVEREDPNVVKAIVSLVPGAHIGRALYFSRATVPSGDGPLYHHIGLYGFRRGALERFIGLPQGQLERRERLEQLRALEHGMRIDVGLVDTVPLGVDTPADLARAREMLGHRPAG